MEYVDLGTGYKLLAFSDYGEFKRVRQLCYDKGKVVAYAGDVQSRKEVHFRQWAYESHGAGWADYQYGHEAYRYKGQPGSVHPGFATARESFLSAVHRLNPGAGYIIVCK